MIIQGLQYSKIPLIAIKTKTLTKYGQKVNFLIQSSDRVEFGLSRNSYFSLRNDSSWAKIGVKTDEISTKYQNPD